MKNSEGKTTSIMAGDLAIINHKKQTLRIKRGKNPLMFEKLHTNSEEGKVVPSFPETIEELHAYGNAATIGDWFGIILTTNGLSAFKLESMTDPNNPDEEFWRLK
ncbi:MAG: hypothetical protein WDK96_02310 [Candidatus Paceibacterota bacterium]|jgi:hypothetical protein